MQRLADGPSGGILKQATAQAPLKFILGANSTIKAFELVSAFLSIGGKGNLQVKSDLAYGMHGEPACGILDNDDLAIEVEIVAVSEPADVSAVMSDEQRLQKIEEVKERATQEYRAQRYQEALAFFKEAHDYASNLS